MTNEEYISLNLDADVRPLALKKAPKGVDVSWCLRQIEGYQLAKKKLPSWADTKGMWYPPRLAMEQCSSEAAATYKSSIVDRLAKDFSKANYVDLTGGFGVDFAYMSKHFNKAIYVERQEELCKVARHNFHVLGLNNAQVLNSDCRTALETLASETDIIYIDPARRSDDGRKTIAISDCTPDVISLQDELFRKSGHIVIKLSPMLDITQALRELKKVKEVHIISIKGECKELLFVLDSSATDDCAAEFHCVNLNTKDAPLISAGRPSARADIARVSTEELHGTALFEPNASIMKARMQAEFAAQYGLTQLHPQSNLFICKKGTDDQSDAEKRKHIPARSFEIIEASDFSKKSIRQLLKDTTKGNLTVRNFPASVAVLRKKLKLQEGGEYYFFATTLANDKHVLIKCLPLNIH